MEFSVSLTPYCLSPESEEILESGEGHKEAVGETIKEEQNEELVVVECDTVVDPRTMMIHLQDTGSTN